jgi:hypothetical protein
MMKNILILIFYTVFSLINVFCFDYDMMLVSGLCFLISYILAIYRMPREIIFIGTALYFVTSFFSKDLNFVFASSYPIIHYSFFYFLSKFGKRKYGKEYVQFIGTGVGMSGDFDLLDIFFTIFSISLFILMYCFYRVI